MGAGTNATTRAETFPSGRAWVDDKGILRLAFEPKSKIDLALAKEQVAAMQRLASGDRLPCLVDMRNIVKTEREAPQLLRRDGDREGGNRVRDGHRGVRRRRRDRQFHDCDLR